MPANNREQLFRMAENALSQFPVEEYRLSFLGHSDNLTFRVETAQQELFLLRIHLPVLPNYRGFQPEESAISAELTWLDALCNEGGVDVQRPVATRSAGWVGHIVQEQGRSVPVTLLTWLPGEHFSPAAPGSEVLAERFGVLVAKLHNFSVAWKAPEGFDRPRYDTKFFRRQMKHLSRGFDHDIISEPDARQLQATSRAILRIIDDLPQTAQYLGLVHADLHVGNFLVDGSRIIPIDFSLCGFGHYLFDLSVCVSGGLKGELRESFLAGYQSLRPLEPGDRRVIEAYALAGRLSYFSSQMVNPTERSWLQRRLPQVIQNDCARFLAGESIIDQF